MIDRDFFISYSTGDAAWAEWVVWQLEEAGFSTVVQAFDFTPGRDFVHEMERGLARCTRCIALLSKDYVQSEMAEAEWRAVFRRDPSGERGLLVPVRITPCDAPELLKARIYIDLVGLPASSARHRLISSLRSSGARPTTEPEFPPDRSRATRAPRFPLDNDAPLSSLVRDESGWPKWRDGHAIVYAEDGERGAYVDVSRYPNFGSVLADIYSSLLVGTVRPYTYGESWYLSGASCPVPLGWVERIGDHVDDVDPEWQSQSPEAASFRSREGYTVQLLGPGVQPRLIGLLGDAQELSALRRHRYKVLHGVLWRIRDDVPPRPSPTPTSARGVVLDLAPELRDGLDLPESAFGRVYDWNDVR